MKTIITKQNQSDIKALLKTHTRSEIAKELNLGYKLVQNYIWRTKQDCKSPYSAKRRKRNHINWRSSLKNISELIEEKTTVSELKGCFRWIQLVKDDNIQNLLIDKLLDKRDSIINNALAN